MKLRYQIAGLLAIPLLFELGFAVALLSSLSHLDEAVAKEAKAKRVIALCLELRSNLLRYNSLVHLTGKFLDPPESAAIQDKTRAAVNSDLRNLQQLVQDNATAGSIFNKYKLELKNFDELLTDLTVHIDATGPVPFSIDSARFIQTDESVEELTASFKRSVDLEEKLRNIYTPMVRDFQPAALRQRALMRTLALSFVCVNCVLVVTLGIVFSKFTLSRLTLLMENIVLFAQKRRDLKTVGGSDELTALNEAFQQMAEDRMQAEELKQSIYGMIAHDMRTPLTSVLLGLEILAMTENNLADRSRQRIKTAESEVQRVIRIANTFLDLERLEEGKLSLTCEWTPVADIVKQSSNACFSLIRTKQLELIEVTEEVDLLYCDADRIVQVLVNLVSNAAKFTPDNTCITLTVRSAKPDKIRFEVQDQGPGIPPDDLSKMFKRFSQLAQEASTKKTGAGLGLYICKMLVDAHDGSIGLHNAPSGGACFWFELPHKALVASGESGSGQAT